MNILRKLIKLGEDIDEMIPELNHGGCSLYAALLASRLEELNLQVRALVIADLDYLQGKYNLCDLYDATKPHNAAQWRDIVPFISHVLIKLDIDGIGYVHDSELTLPHHKFMEEHSWGVDPLPGDISVSVLRALASATGWNTCFNRRKYFPLIEYIIEKHLGAFVRTRNRRYIRSETG